MREIHPLVDQPISVYKHLCAIPGTMSSQRVSDTCGSGSVDQRTGGRRTQTQRFKQTVTTIVYNLSPNRNKL